MKTADMELRNDKAYMLEAMRVSHSALEFAGEGVKGDREFALEAMYIDGAALKHLSSELRGDTEIVLEAMKSDTFLVLEWATKELQCDRKIVLEAVKQIAYSLSSRKTSIEATESRKEKWRRSASKEDYMRFVVEAAKMLDGVLKSFPHGKEVTHEREIALKAAIEVLSNRKKKEEEEKEVGGGGIEGEEEVALVHEGMKRSDCKSQPRKRQRGKECQGVGQSAEEVNPRKRRK